MGEGERWSKIEGQGREEKGEERERGLIGERRGNNFRWRNVPHQGSHRY